MVQVDVFWAYGLGATLAAASGRQLKAASEGRLESDSEIRINKNDSPFYNKFFVKALLFLSLVWAPTGMILLLKHPSWETMQVFTGIESLAQYPFLVLAFGITNITQGILGYWVAYTLFKKGHYYWAHFQWLIGYFCMFFILIYGWDGLGYDRFLYDRAMFGNVPWSPGAGIQPGAGINFLVSSVAMTLYMDGAFLLPVMMLMWGRWLRQGAQIDKTVPRDRVPAGIGKNILFLLFCIFVIGLGSAAIAVLVVHYMGMLVGHVMGYVLGLPIFAVLGYFILYRKGGPVYKFMKLIFIQEPSE